MLVSVCKKTRHFLASEDGPAAVEYCIMTLLVFLAVIAAIEILGDITSGSLQSSADKIENAIGAADGR